MHREPEVPVVERLDGLARITLQELAITHFVKNGIPQSACSTRQKVDADLGTSALVHTARLMNSLAKGLKRMVTKCSGYVENYTTIGLHTSRYGAAEVYNYFAEELKHTEANPMCSIHQSCVTSC